MATITAAASGNWSNTATWTGGVLPGPGDIAEAGGKTVTIDQDVTCLTIQNTAGGGYQCSTARTINANINVTGSAVCFSFTGVSGIVLVINGNITHNGTAHNGYAVTNGGAGTININGNCTGGNNNLLSPAAVVNTSSGIINIVGNCTAGGGGAGDGPCGAINQSNGSITITGNCTGGSISIAYGAYNKSNGTVTINGNCIGGTATGAYGAYNAASGTMTVNGLAVGNGYGAGSTGLSECPGIWGSQAGLTTVKGVKYGLRGQSPTAGVVRVIGGTDNTCTVTLYDGANTPKTLTDPAAAADFPTPSNVRYQTAYNNGNLVGTLRVPAASQVAYGVAVDNTTGTAALTPQDVAEAMLLAPAGGTLGAASYSPFWYLGAVKYQLDTGGPTRVELQAVKAKTDYLPSGTAGSAGGVAIVGSAMTLAANQDVRNVTGTVNGQLDATAVQNASQAGATAALNAYDPPTRSEATADKAEVIAAIPSLSQVEEDAAAAKTAAQSADLKATNIQAAVYDSASVSGDVITLSNGKTQTVTSGGRVTSV